MERDHAVERPVGDRKLSEVTPDGGRAEDMFDCPFRTVGCKSLKNFTTPGSRMT